jgi:hypothetical protein
MFPPISGMSSRTPTGTLGVYWDALLMIELASSSAKMGIEVGFTRFLNGYRSKMPLLHKDTIYCYTGVKWL